MTICKYSNIFGEPNTGLHKIRIFNLAVVDILFTFIGAYLIYYYVNKKYNKDVNYFVYLIGLFILGIIMHKIFCVQTTVNKYLFTE